MFISTILMVVVLVVALSTATFAWYTSSTNATATDASLTAAHSDSANIAVGWTNDAVSTTVDLTRLDTVNVAPMVPDAVPEVGTTQFTGLTFKTATIDTQNKFANVATGNPWTISHKDAEDDDTADTSFYVINHNVNAGATITMTCNIGGENANKLLVAVFVNDKFAGIFTQKTGYTVGSGLDDDKCVKTGNEAVSLETEEDTGIAENITFTLAKSGESGDSAQITLKAWLDGNDLTQSYANKTATFAFTFDTAPVAP